MKRKFLSLFVCITIFASFIPLWTMSVSATANTMTRDGETRLFSEDFEGYNGHTINVAYPRNTPTKADNYILPSSDTDGHIMWAGGTTTIDGDSSAWRSFDPTGRGGGKALRLCSHQESNNGRDFGIFTPYNTRVSSGIVHASMDFKIPTAATDGGTDLSGLVIYIFPDDSIFSGNATRIAQDGNVWNNLTGDTWYTMDLWVDLDQDIFSVSFYDDTGIVAYQNMDGYTYNFSGIRFALKKNDKTGAWNNISPQIDNVWIGTLNNTTASPLRIEGEKTLFYEAFESTAANGADWNDNDYQTEGGFRSWNSNGALPGFNSRYSFSPIYGLDTDSRTLEWYRPDPDGSSGPESCGIYHVRFNYRPGTYATSGHNLYIYSYNSTLQESGAKKLKGTKVSLLGRDTINGYGNRWVTIDLIIAEGNKAMLIVSNATTGENISTTNNIALGSFDKFYAVVFSVGGPSTGWTQLNAPSIDNFYVGVGYNYSYLQQTLVSENFDSWTDSTMSGYKDDDAKTTGGFRTSTQYYGRNYAYESGKCVDIGLWIAGTRINSLDYYIGANNPKQQTGQIHIQFDWRKGTQTTHNSILLGEDDNKNASPATYMSAIPSDRLAALDTDTWYTIDIMLDLDAKMLDWRIYTINDNDMVIADSGYSEYTKSNFGYIAWECSKGNTEIWTQPGTSSVDNFYMGKIKDNSLSVSLDGSTITASADVRNCMISQSKPAVLIIGQYDASGDLIKVDLAEQTPLSVNTIAGGSKSTTATKLGTAASVKAFLWNDLTNFRPLLESEDLE